MFYSQFILAKKGPLGTIWIAAHLERKLRKNQVADTDIGVSVDSIIFPEVPIALRLSSHLLLGVVRIYSRKVNYLFHDCSEALLKIKQAFRSTAVDLPPEESTAPYHSITLPETFHLDDFELPDSALLNGNIVDRHVSQREQITLQDTRDEDVYHTSQFGLDERFGDGDASQIHLDLGEVVYVDKLNFPLNDASMLSSVENVLHQGQTSISLDDVYVEGGLMENEKDSFPGFSKDLPDLLVGDSDRDDNLSCVVVSKRNESSCMQIYNIHTPDLNESVYQDEQIINSNVLPKDIVAIPSGDGAQSPDITELAQGPSTPGIVEEGPASAQEIPAMRLPEKTCHVNDEAIKSETEDILMGKFSAETVPLLQDEMVIDNKMSDQVPHFEYVVDHEEGIQVKPTSPSCYNEASEMRPFHENALPVEKVSGSASEMDSLGTLIPVNMSLGQDMLICSTEILDKMETVEKEEPSVQAQDIEKLYDIESGVLSKDVTVENSNCSSFSEVLDVEKMLSAPTPSVDLPIVLGEITLEKNAIDAEGSDGQLKRLTGRKRSLETNTSVLKNCSSNKMSSVRGRAGSEYIPDDDDLLASILAGRQISNLKMKTSSPLLKSGIKRPRLTPNIGMNKRKVLMDDTIVLHADTIRQQLMNTEDIRRLRKKAPCTRSEICVIEKCSLEKDIFNDSIFIGMSMELNVLLAQKHKLNGAQKHKLNGAQNLQVDILIPEPHTPKEMNLNEISVLVSVVSAKDSLEPLSIERPSSSFASTLKDAFEAGDVQTVSPSGQSHLEDSSSNRIFDSHKLYIQDKHFSSIVEVRHCGNDSGILSGPLEELQPAAKFAEGEEVRIRNIVIEGRPIDEFGHTISEVSSVESTFENASGISTDVVGTAVVMNDVFPVRSRSSADDNTNSFGVDTIFCTADGKLSVYNEEQTGIVVGAGQNGLVVSCDGEIVVDELLINHNCVEIYNEVPQVIEESKRVSPAVGETSGLHDLKSDGDMNVECCFPIGLTGVKESSDFCSVIQGNGTDFLNVNDDSDCDEADNDIENPEENQSMENSGWSSRTRGVARYLKLLFKNESLRGKKLAMDRLLYGKTRKEASRMFFETLVLTTKDYIHVDQENPFDYISLQPKIKLLKSDF